MKLIVSLLVAVAAAVHAANVNTIDAGGQRATSASYVNDGSVGNISGISGTGAQVARHGYPGQLTEVVSLTVTSTPSSVSECSTSQITGTVTMDDATITELAGSDIAWGAVTYPVLSLDSNGVLTAAYVYGVATGMVNGVCLGMAGSTSVQVIGPYASSSIPGAWFLQYFGAPPNPLAAPTADATGTGQNNLFKYVTGLNPTNAVSRFVLKIASVPGQPGQQRLIFSPRLSDRTYTVEYVTNLVNGAFANLTLTSTSDNGLERTVTDLNGTASAKFYRMKIAYP